MWLSSLELVAVTEWIVPIFVSAVLSLDLTMEFNMEFSMILHVNFAYVSEFAAAGAKNGQNDLHM